MTDTTTSTTCGHCHAPIANPSRGHAEDGTPLCHTGTLPPICDPPDCYRLVTVYGHRADGLCRIPASGYARTPPDPGASIQQIAEFYDTTDTTTLDSVEVELEPSRAPMVSRSVRMARSDMDALRVLAKARNAGVTALMRQWVLERLALELAPRVDPSPRVTVTLRPPSTAPDRGAITQVMAMARVRQGTMLQ